MERGEKLGINQAVREAMGELRRNMQTLNDARVAPRTQPGGDAGAAVTLAAMDRRSKQLATFLNETVADLKALSASNLEDKVKSLQMIEVAAAKVQFVQIYLEDSTMDVPNLPGVATSKTEVAAGSDVKSDKIAPALVPTKGERPVTAIESVKEDKSERPPVPEKQPALVTESPAVKSSPAPKPAPMPAPVATQAPAAPPKPEAKGPSKAATGPSAEQGTKAESSTTAAAEADPAEKKPATPAKPQPSPLPTRSTIAQSSFSWMLEPDESTPSATAAAAASQGSKSPPQAQVQVRKRASNIGRDRNAFLFGDGDEEAAGGDPLRSGGIFGLESVSKSKAKKTERAEEDAV